MINDWEQRIKNYQDATCDNRNIKYQVYNYVTSNSSITDACIVPKGTITNCVKIRIVSNDNA